MAMVESWIATEITSPSTAVTVPSPLNRPSLLVAGGVELSPTVAAFSWHGSCPGAVVAGASVLVGVEAAGVTGEGDAGRNDVPATRAAPTPATQATPIVARVATRRRWRRRTSCCTAEARLGLS